MRPRASWVAPGKDPSPVDGATEGTDLLRALENLEQVELEVIALRYGLRGPGSLSPHSVATRLGITEEEARRTELLALRRLQRFDESRPSLH